jgi:uncharacterized protein (DUF433 family)
VVCVCFRLVTLAENIDSGKGLYLSEEAAFYARIHPATMKRWLDGGHAGERVFQPSMDGGEKQFATFLDFVQAMAIRSIRTNPTLKISLQKIRASVNYATERGITYPFARKHTTFWDGHDIHIRIGNADYTQATGKLVHQTSIRQIVEVYMKDLRFNETTGLADSYKAFSWGGHDIEMNPEIRFGEPIVTSCGYTAQSLWEACETEGSVSAGANAYGVKESEAECAARYFDYLQPKIAA